MAKIDLSKFIVPQILENTNTEGRVDETFKTEDLIYLQSSDDINYCAILNISYPTDYAVMNGAVMNVENEGIRKRKSCSTLFRSANSDCRVVCINF